MKEIAGGAALFLIWLLQALFFAIVNAKGAKRQGRSRLVWFLMGFVFSFNGLFALLYATVVFPKSKKEPLPALEQAEDTKL